MLREKDQRHRTDQRGDVLDEEVEVLVDGVHRQLVLTVGVFSARQVLRAHLVEREFLAVVVVNDTGHVRLALQQPVGVAGRLVQGQDRLLSFLRPRPSRVRALERLAQQQLVSLPLVPRLLIDALLRAAVLVDSRRAPRGLQRKTGYLTEIG